MEFAKQLSKHIALDIYGKCGSMKCPLTKKRECYTKLKRDYKFYLAFENSNCKGYITEKLFWNAYRLVLNMQFITIQFCTIKLN